MAASIWNPNGQVSVPELPAVAPVTFVKGTAGNPGINFVGDTETGIWSQADGYLNFAVNGVNVLTIDSSGNIVANKFVSGVEIDVASAAVTDIGSQLSNTVRITGTNNITSFGTTYRGPIFVRFASALILTHNASTLILPGAANISISAGDTLIAIPKATAGVSDGWFVVGYTSLVPLLNAVTSITGAASGMTISNVISVNGGQLAGLRNRIINGGMNVNQRGVAGTLPSTFSYSLDRWLVSSASAVPSGAQSATNSAGSQLSNTLVVTGVTGNTGVNIRHRIEACNCRDMAGQTVTLSWWAFQSTGSAMNVTCSIAYANATDNFTSVTAIGLSSATAVSSGGNFTKITATFAVPSAATTGLEVVLFANTPALLGAQVLGIANVQLELGSVATPFEQRPYGMELALCQRYYRTGRVYLRTYQAASSVFAYRTEFQMRAAPTIAYQNTTYLNASSIVSAEVDASGLTVAATATVSGATFLASDYTASAEL